MANDCESLELAICETNSSSLIKSFFLTQKLSIQLYFTFRPNWIKKVTSPVHDFEFDLWCDFFIDLLIFIRKGSGFLKRIALLVFYPKRKSALFVLFLKHSN